MRLLVAIGLLLAFFIPIIMALLSVLHDLFIHDRRSIPELSSHGNSESSFDERKQVFVDRLGFRR